jgi:hypothetical protein
LEQGHVCPHGKIQDQLFWATFPQMSQGSNRPHFIVTNKQTN